MALDDIDPTIEGRIVLPRSKKGRARASRLALWRILTEDPAFKDRFSFDEMRGLVLLRGQALSEQDLHHLLCEIEARYRFGYVPEGEASQTVIAVAKRASFNPVVDYLRKTKWDGTGRLGSVAASILGVEPSMWSDLYARMVEVWMLSAVARAHKPGCKADSILVLVGGQGTYKSTFFQTLVAGAGEGFFTDSPIAVGQKDGFSSLAGIWVAEWGEMEDYLSKKTSGLIKAFLASQVDRYRPAYGRYVTTTPRRCVIGGSSNRFELLRDPTGSRRFMCIPTGTINVDRLRDDREQLWAEAEARFQAGEGWHLTDTEVGQLEVANRIFTAGQSLEERLRTALLGIAEVTLDQATKLLWPERYSRIRVADALRVLGFVNKHVTSGNVWVRTVTLS